MQAKRVLVTGSAGSVGRSACRGLAEAGHFVRGFDRAPTPDDLGIAESVVGDITDAQALDKAAKGVDTIVHLAANPDESAEFLTGLLEPNIVGLYRVCEAARIHKVRRLVITSTIMVVWEMPLTERVIGLEDGVAPTCHYALTKVYAEDMARMYAREHGLSTVAIRLGWLPRSQAQTDDLASKPQFHPIYLSVPDAARAYVCSVNSPTPAAGEFAAMFITSRSDGEIGVDLEPAKRWIGYEPRDRWPDNLDAGFTVER